MGWFNTVLDVASLGAEVSQLGKLDDLRNQGATAAMMQAILQQLRNQIFNYKQAAQSIVEAEGVDPKPAAGAMRVVELRLQDSGITPELFSDLNDKEYVANTYKFVSTNSQRLKGLLPAPLQEEMEKIAQAAHQLPEYGYYLSHYDDLKKYQAAKADKEKYGMLSAGGGLFLGCGVIILFVVIVGIFLSIFRDSPMVGLVIASILSVVGAIYIGRFTRRGRDAKKTIETLEKSVDIDYLQSLDQKYQGNKTQVEQKQAYAHAAIRQFFGDSPLLPI